MNKEAIIRMAREALELIDKEFKKHGRQHWPEAVKARNAASALRAALAEPVQEPVAWLFTNLQSGDYDFCYQEDEHDHDREMWHKQPLYIAPPQRKPLTEVDLRALYDGHAAYQEEGPEASGWWGFARAIERAHGIRGEE